MNSILKLSKKIIRVISPKHKIELLSLSILNLITGFLEVLSVGMIPAFIIFMINPLKITEIITIEKIREPLIQFLELNSKEDNLIYAIILIIIIFSFKNLFIFFVGYYDAHFRRRLNTHYTTKIFNNYIKRDYDFFVNNSSSEITKNIDSTVIISSSINCLLNIIKETSIIFGLVILVLKSNFIISIAMVVVIALLLIFYKSAFSSILYKQGKKSYIFKKNIFLTIKEFFNSILDIKITNKENYFNDLFTEIKWKAESTTFVKKILTIILRPLVETLAIISMMVFIYFQVIVVKISFQELIPLIALIAISLIRLIPSVSNFMLNFNALKTEESQVNHLISVLDKENFINEEKIKKNLSFKENIKLKNIEYNTDYNIFKGLKNINLEINKNDTIGIIGKTGSGKTTLINIITNLFHFTGGQMIVDDEIKIEKGERFRFQNLYYLSQKISILNDTVKRNVAFGVDEKSIDEKKVKSCLETVNLLNFSKNIENLVGEDGIKISGGEKQLLGLARALYFDPKIIIFDESTSSLDYKTEENFLKVINNLNITKLIVAHRINTLKNCNKIILLDDGKIIDSGKLEYFFSKYEDLKRFID